MTKVYSVKRLTDSVEEFSCCVVDGVGNYLCILVASLVTQPDGFVRCGTLLVSNYSSKSFLGMNYVSLVSEFLNRLQYYIVAGKSSIDLFNSGSEVL